MQGTLQTNSGRMAWIKGKAKHLHHYGGKDYSMGKLSNKIEEQCRFHSSFAPFGYPA